MTTCCERVDPKLSCFSWKWRELSGCTVLQPSGRPQRRTASIAPWHSRRFVDTSENYHTGQLNERVTGVKSRYRSLRGFGRHRPLATFKFLIRASESLLVLRFICVHYGEQRCRDNHSPKGPHNSEYDRCEDGGPDGHLGGSPHDVRLEQ